MNLFESISRRKSCRKYTAQPLNKAQLDEIKTAIGGFEPLYPDVPLSYRFVSKTTGLFRVEAPHYLIISGQGAEGEKENAGFIGEQLVLWFDARGIGSVWLGKTKDAEKSHGGKDIIAIAFGEPDTPLHRSASEFKRKPIAEISNTPGDACIQAAHFAPSGMNLQPWFFEKAGDKVIVYEQILKPPVSLAYKITRVDMGIALCHYALASRRFERPFTFQAKSGVSAKKGYKLFGEISEKPASK